MNKLPAISGEGIQRDIIATELEKLRTTVREDAYKRGFWFGVIAATTLLLAALLAGVFFGL